MLQFDMILIRFRNTQLLRRLPHGFTATATVQVAGRGRGSNVWISPAGSLIFSTVVRHPIEKIQSAPVIFIQYLSAMAVVKGIKSYAKGYENLPVKMKWPNDICMLKTFVRSNVLFVLTQLSRCSRPGGPRAEEIYQDLRYPHQLPLHVKRIYLRCRNWH